jgi:hypothetical protein
VTPPTTCWPSPASRSGTGRKTGPPTPSSRSTKRFKRRTDVVGVFPNPEALLRLAGAVLVETHDEWAVTDRRYLSENSMKNLTVSTKEVATSTALTA